MMQSKFNTDVSHLICISSETICGETAHIAFAQSAQSAETLQTLYSTQTRRDNSLLMSMIDPLFFGFFLFFLTIYAWKQEDFIFR